MPSTRLAAPGPDRRADEVDRLHARRFQLGLDAEVEVGRVDADEGIGLVGEQALDQAVPDREDLAEMAEHLEVAAHRELVVRPPGDEAALGHARAADAFGDEPRPARPQAGEQRAGEQVARSLARDHREPGSVRVHPRGSRLSERCRAWPRRGSRRPGGRRRPLPASPRRARRSWRARRRRSARPDTAGDASA